MEENKFRVELGRRGEKIAESYLLECGYTIIARNHRIGHSDIDILAMDGDVLVFVEVRTRSYADSGMPEESLNRNKLRRMRRTAELYITGSGYKGRARLDAVCIVLDRVNGPAYFEHYRDVQ
ncbi:MAG: YraN family protein [Spirochaetales bacterium]|nr:YraN family protein [Spirochaetales bacterium]